MVNRWQRCMGVGPMGVAGRKRLGTQVGELELGRFLGSDGGGRGPIHAARPKEKRGTVL